MYVAPEGNSRAGVTVRGSNSLRLLPPPKVGPQFDSPSDLPLFIHWATVLPGLAYPCPQQYQNILPEHLSLVWDRDSVLLPIVLAFSAAHMAASGAISQVEVLERKSKALSIMNGSLLVHQKEISHIDSKIAASMILASLEIAGGPKVLLPFLNGIKALLELRWTRACGSISPFAIANRNLSYAPRPLAIHIKMMAYFDVMCSVPCAKKPITDQSFWDHHIWPPHQHLGSDPDLVLGFASTSLLITGDAAALVEASFNGDLELDEIHNRRTELLRRSRDAVESLPSKIHQPYSHPDSTDQESQNYNACIDVAHAHCLATSIFLYRGIQSVYSARLDDCDVSQAIAELFTLCFRVPMTSSAITMILWPMFVLGCESEGGSSLRAAVASSLNYLYEKQHFPNILEIIRALQQRVWPGESRNCDGRRTFGEQNMEWVQFCWEERIELCLA